MASRSALEMAVTIRREDCTSFAIANGKATFLPLAGETTGLVSGSVRPGGVDMRVTDPAGGVCIKNIDPDEE